MDDQDIAEVLYDENTISFLVADPDEPTVYISDAKSRDDLDAEIEEDTELFLRHTGTDGTGVLRDLCLHRIGDSGSLGESLEEMLAYMFERGRMYERYVQRAEDGHAD